MECQRCLLGKEARYRVYIYGGAMETKVCAPCADEARTLGLAVEALDRGEEKDRRTVGGDRLSSI